MNKIVKRFLFTSLSLLIILFFWYVIAYWVRFAKGVIFPTPHDTFLRFFHLLGGIDLYNEALYRHVSSSLIRWGLGYGLAVVLGILFGLWLGASNLFYELIMPAVYFIQLIPGLAWIPIALLIFGLGNASTIFMIFIIGITPIIINTSGGIRGIPPQFVKTAQMMGASRPVIFFKVMVPAATLSILNGLRIGLANAWRVLIAAEMIVGVGVGLGYIIIQSRWSLDFEAAFVSILIICTIGLIIEKGLFAIIEKNVMLKQGLAKGV